MTYPATIRSPGLKMKSAVLLLAGGLAVAAAGTALASPANTDVAKVAVYYTEASLATDSGAQSLYHRIVRAAEEVCEDQVTAGSRLPSNAEQKCRRQAIATAVEKVHNPRLVAVYTSSAKSG